MCVYLSSILVCVVYLVTNRLLIGSILFAILTLSLDCLLFHVQSGILWTKTAFCDIKEYLTEAGHGKSVRSLTNRKTMREQKKSQISLLPKEQSDQGVSYSLYSTIYLLGTMVDSPDHELGKSDTWG